jgi:hypothetical protein
MGSTPGGYCVVKARDHQAQLAKRGGRQSGPHSFRDVAESRSPRLYRGGIKRDDNRAASDADAHSRHLTNELPYTRLSRRDLVVARIWVALTIVLPVALTCTWLFDDYLRQCDPPRITIGSTPSERIAPPPAACVSIPADPGPDECDPIGRTLSERYWVRDLKNRLQACGLDPDNNVTFDFAPGAIRAILAMPYGLPPRIYERHAEP